MNKSRRSGVEQWEWFEIKHTVHILEMHLFDQRPSASELFPTLAHKVMDPPPQQSLRVRETITINYSVQLLEREFIWSAFSTRVDGKGDAAIELIEKPAHPSKE